ncbi:hypothetical protein ACG7TL_008781 [Trametes sanguinea]
MDEASLRRLKRADIQKLAKRDGIRANQKTEAMIRSLINKHAPSLVPFMDSIAPTTEQEAISKKILRRQGLSSIPVQAASPEVPAPQLRRSARRREAHPAPSTSAQQAPIVAPDHPESVSSAPASQVPRIGRLESTAAQAMTVDEILEAAVALSHTQVSAGASMSASASRMTKVGETSVRSASANVNARPAQQKSSPRAVEKQKEDVSPDENVQQGSEQDAEPPVVPTSATPTSRVLTPIAPSLSASSVLSSADATLRSHSQAYKGTIAPLLLPISHFSPGASSSLRRKTNSKPCARAQCNLQTSEQAQERASPRVSPGPLHTLPPLAGPPHVANMSYTRSSPPSAPSLPDVPIRVYRPPIAEARVLLNELGPVIDEDHAIRGFLGEMNVILDHEEERAQDINQRLRKVQRLRLAMQELFFDKLKTDPRILAGTWVPDEAPQGQTESSGSGRQPEQRVEETMEEENEIREVEEMTSRELMSSDLPSPPSQPSSKGRGKRRMPVDEDDSTDEDEDPESPCKRPRRS